MRDTGCSLPWEFDVTGEASPRTLSPETCCSVLEADVGKQPACPGLSDQSSDVVRVLIGWQLGGLTALPGLGSPVAAVAPEAHLRHDSGEHQPQESAEAELAQTARLTQCL